jgi:RecB family endonuclease NucS
MYLAENPSLLGDGLEFEAIEHEFISLDKVDILLKDENGNPVTVEVESHIRPRNYVGVWQAVKYKHLAAVECELPCEQVRSILAAPEIPDDVKMKCEQLGIEFKEVS